MTVIIWIVSGYSSVLYGFGKRITSRPNTAKEKFQEAIQVTIVCIDGSPGFHISIMILSTSRLKGWILSFWLSGVKVEKLSSHSAVRRGNVHVGQFSNCTQSSFFPTYFAYVMSIWCSLWYLKFGISWYSRKYLFSNHVSWRSLKKGGCNSLAFLFLALNDKPLMLLIEVKFFFIWDASSVFICSFAWDNLYRKRFD